jgi:class 3 adenylate cyclase
MIAAMAGESKSFEHPDEVFENPGVVQQAVTIGDLTVARSTAMPGWRWSVHMRPIVGGKWCQARHVGTITSGSFAFEYPDGTRTELHAGDVYDMPPGHDGYVVGDQPVSVIEWGGVRAFNSFRGGTKSRRLLTLLLTDLVDSTPTASRVGDPVWRDMLSVHYEMARNQLERFDGREVKTTGDGMLSTFESPAQALWCAQEIRERTHDERLQMRAGVHIGEVEVVGADLRGVAVHEVARITSAAEPDEVLVSELTRTIAGTSGIAFDDRGMHTLKGIGEAHLFAYVAR